MAQIAYNPKFQAFDSAGDPLASGKLYTYAAGTSTPKDTWADAGEVTLNANPVVLDSRGEATIYGNGSYKFILKDSADATIWTVDNIAIGGTVVTADIADGAITTAKLASNVLSSDATGRGKMQDGFVTSAKLDTAGVALPNGSTATTQSTGDNTTKPATTAFVQGEFTDKTASQAEQEAGTSTTDFVTPGRQHFHPSACKGWGYVTVAAGTATLQSGYNITSVSRTSAGLFNVVIANDMSSTNYAVIVTPEDDTTRIFRAGYTGKAAGSFNVVVQNASFSNDDPAAFSFLIFGDI